MSKTEKSKTEEPATNAQDSNPDMSDTAKHTTVSVKILEKEYQVACPDDEVDALTASARYLDKQMTEIRDTGKVFGLDRIAVMAALNIANEFLANYYIPRWSWNNPEAAWQAFRKLPGGTPSDPVRRATTRLFGSRRDQAEFHRKLWQQQALLQVYSDFCLQDASDCEDCPFPEQLRQW